MTARNALVLINGSVRELPAGDTLNGAGAGNGTGGGTSVAKFTYSGSLTAQQGKARWYPDRAITLTSVYFSIGTASVALVQIDVRKNGASIFSGTVPVCTSGLYKSTVVPVGVNVDVTDYLTVDITSASPDASNLTAVMTYQ